MVSIDLLLLAPLAFTIGFIDIVFGMGYGTILTPILIIAGFHPLRAISAVVFSQFLGSFASSILHHKLGNVNFSRRSLDLRVAITLSVPSFIGPLIAYNIASNIPIFYVKLYISVALIIIGAIVFLGIKGVKPSWRRILLLSFIAGFNKGFTGGGYGPIVTSGQIVSGIKAKSAVAITSLARGIACLTTVLAYTLGGMLDLKITLYLTVGILLSTPTATYTVRRVRTRSLRHGIGILTLTLGAIILLKTLLDVNVM